MSLGDILYTLWSILEAIVALSIPILIVLGLVGLGVQTLISLFAWMF